MTYLRADMHSPYVTISLYDLLSSLLSSVLQSYFANEFQSRDASSL